MNKQKQNRQKEPGRERESRTERVKNWAIKSTSTQRDIKNDFIIQDFYV